MALVSSSAPTSPLLQEAVRRLAPVLPILTELGDVILAGFLGAAVRTGAEM